MKDNPKLQHDDLPIWLALKIKFEGLHASTTSCRSFAIHPRDQDDPHDDAHSEGENNAKRQRTYEHETYVFGESSSGQANKSKPGPSTLGNQEQLDDFDFGTNTYTTDDDEFSTEKVSQELVKDMSQIVDEAKLCKVVNEMLRQRRTSGDEHQYHFDQMKNFLKMILCGKKGNIEPKKIVLSLHKFTAVIFPDDDNKERTSRWCQTLKESICKDLLVKETKKGKPKEKVYSNSKIVQIIKTNGKLGHEHKFITKIISRRENGSIVSVTESDYKNLNKNDIKDMYLLIVNGKLGVEIYQQKVNLTAPTITFPCIEKHKMFSVVSEPVYGIIYKNNKKEKRMMRHQDIHKFCDATLKRVFEGLKSYNNNVKHGYVTPSLSQEDDEYLQLFKKETEEQLKHHDKMRR
uniref:Uncharacterized protein n=1 Tax=Tanacetum cinerariifolium TaxID=118510 RepID=A0A6L2NRF6_TANCI|nr:hypothetical protein [Tanacetum cinerariifolium]